MHTDKSKKFDNRDVDNSWNIVNSVKTKNVDCENTKSKKGDEKKNTLENYRDKRNSKQIDIK